MFVLPNRVIQPECRRAASGKRMPPDQPVRKRTDHSGLSPHKAHTPGVKKILRRRGLETPSVPRSDALSAWLARPNRAHSRIAAVRCCGDVSPGVSIVCARANRSSATIEVATSQRSLDSHWALSPEPGTRPEPTLSSQHNDREERNARQFRTQVFPHVPVL